MTVEQIAAVVDGVLGEEVDDVRFGQIVDGLAAGLGV